MLVLPALIVESETVTEPAESALSRGRKDLVITTFLARMSNDEHPEASTAFSVVATVIAQGPLYFVRVVPAGTPVFPGPGHAPPDVVPGDVGATAEVDVVVREVDELDELDELLGTDVAVAGTEPLELDVVEVEVRVVERHHGGLRLHHPLP
jgi:hypothetical protein